MGHGGARVGAGRPKKNKDENALAKNTAGFVPEKKFPVPVKVKYENTLEEYHAMAMKEAADVLPSAETVRNEILVYIKAMGCEGFVPPNVIDDYVINRIGFLACKATNKRIGRMTKDLKLSPYVTAANSYYRAMQSDFQIILHIIYKFGGQPKVETENAFLKLLTFGITMLVR